jgi:uncharacterized membrane protein YfcA
LEKDTILAIFGASVGLAGVLLVFVGFIFSHAESFQNVGRKKSFQRIAKAGLVPFAISLFAAWLGLGWLQFQDPTVYYLALLSFKFAIATTLLYGVISVVFFL